MTKRVALTTILALALPAGAAASTPPTQYVLRHPRRQHCRTGYIRKIKHPRIHGKRVRRVYCVWVKPAPKPIPTTTVAPATTAPRAVSLHSHLDPSFVQSPSNPLAVTYTYSASAAEEAVGSIATPVASLPAGVLNLYSDGLLMCSINVGGPASGGECLVRYSTSGAHTVITTYTSGTLSTAETAVEQIESYATATTDAVTSRTEGGGDIVWNVTASVTSNGTPISGPILYTVTDTTAGTVEAQATLSSGSPCVIHEAHGVQNPSVTYSGGEDGTEGACGFGEFNVPGSDAIVVVPSFTGIPGYLPSSGNTLGI